MSTVVTLNGINYNIPAYNDTGWAQGTGNLSQYLIALAAVVASSPAFIQITNVSSSPTNIVTGHTYLVNTNAAVITLNLPTPAANVWMMIKDIAGNAQNNNITLHRHGSELIDGTASDKVLSLPNDLCIIISDGTDWYILLEI